MINGMAVSVAICPSVYAICLRMHPFIRLSIQHHNHERNTCYISYLFTMLTTTIHDFKTASFAQVDLSVGTKRPYELESVPPLRILFSLRFENEIVLENKSNRVDLRLVC